MCECVPAHYALEHCKDGVSNTFSIAAVSLGKSPEDRTANLAAVLDGYFERGQGGSDEGLARRPNSFFSRRACVEVLTQEVRVSEGRGENQKKKGTRPPRESP